MDLTKANGVALFGDFHSNTKKSRKIGADRLSDLCPKLFKKESGCGRFSTSSVPFEALLTGEFVLPCSIHSYVRNAFKLTTPDEIVEELESLLDKLTDFCGSDSDFVKLLNFSLALCDCFGHVFFGCESPELRAKLVRLHERIKHLSSAHFLFVKNMSLIKNKSAFIPTMADHSDYTVEQIRMYEL